MKYWKNVIIGSSVIITAIVVALFVYYFSQDSCPSGTFLCTSGGKCVPQRSVCNNYPDCPNEEDEDPVLCTDLHGSVNMVDSLLLNISLNETMEFQKKIDTCDVPQYPSPCICGYSVRIYCQEVGLQSVPQNISTSITHIILANNTIQQLHRNSFSKYNLKFIQLEGNGLTHLPPYVFAEQKNLERLFIMNNNLSYIEPGVFKGLHKLLWLFLQRNKLETIYFEDFVDLNATQWINLSHNKLSLDEQQFPLMPALMELVIDANEIKQVGKSTFNNLIKLELLSLRENKISHIDSEALRNLYNLRELDLFGNHLKELSSNVFDSLTLLTKMNLGQNPFNYIPGQLFKNLKQLGSLNMEKIEIKNIDVGMFDNLHKLESVYFKKYYYCSYAPRVPRCRPVSDGISSIDQLLFKPIFRYGTWIICVTTCIGNILVFWGRFVFRDENRVLSLVIRNLAVSDFLMGVYLLVIGIQDFKFRDVYNMEAHNWISSWGCTFTGIIGMISSEVSVLLLVFMSIDRFLLIAIPFGRYSSLNVKETAVILISIWGIGISIAVIPVLEFHSSTRFYGVNGLCFPLHIDDPYFIGWEFSAIIFFGINATSLLVIGLVYSGMFISIWKTRNATSLPLKDFEFAVRFFFIVLTDASCWLPIICVKASAFFGTEISADLYGWLVVFILPINSALNPLLYTFTTPKYRNQIYRVPVCIKDAGGSRTSKTPPQSGGDTGSIPLNSRSGQSINRKPLISKF